jgi:hypothetical protein
MGPPMVGPYGAPYRGPMGPNGPIWAPIYTYIYIYIYIYLYIYIYNINSTTSMNTNTPDVSIWFRSMIRILLLVQLNNEKKTIGRKDTSTLTW